MPQPNRHNPTPRDLAKQIAERLATTDPAETRFSFRNSVFIGRLVSGAIVLLVSAIVLVGVVFGTNWLLERVSAGTPEVLSERVEAGDIGGDGFGVTSTSTTAPLGGLALPIARLSTTTSIPLGPVTTITPIVTGVTIPPPTTTTEASTTATQGPTTTSAPGATTPSSPVTTSQPTTSTSRATTTTAATPTSSSSSPTTTSTTTTTTIATTTTTITATTTTILPTTTTTPPSTTCGNNGQGNGNC